MTRKFLAGLVLPAVAALAAACSSGDAPAHNAADVTFAQDMIPHHQQAVRMAGPVAQHTTDAALIALAQRVRQAQQPEIDQLTAWLGSWGSAPMPAMSGMPGMVDDAGLDRLNGPAYDRKWLQLMVSHHQGAVTMARTELAQGGNADAKSMAQRIVDTQQAEIAEMNGMLAG